MIYKIDNMKQLFMERFIKKIVLSIAAMLFVFTAPAVNDAVFNNGILTISDLVAGQLKATIDGKVTTANLGNVKQLIITSGTINSDDIKDGIVVSGTAGVAKYLPNIEVIDLVGAIMTGGDLRIHGFCFRQIPLVKVIKLPSGCTGLSGDSFPGCPELEEIWLPKEFYDLGSTNMGANFWLTTKLKKFVVDSDNTTFKAGADGVLYSADGLTLIKYPIGKPESSYTIAAGTVVIGSCAFRFDDNSSACTSNLENVFVTEGVATIQSDAFRYLRPAIKSIILPVSLETIEGGALCQLADPSQPQIIFQNPVLPLTPAGISGTIWDVTTGWIGVPAEKLEEYRAWYVSSVGGDVGKQSFISPRVKAFNTITVTNGTTLYPVAVGGADIHVPITTTLPDFIHWSTTHPDVVFADRTNPNTTFSLPASVEGQEIEITAENVLRNSVLTARCTASVNMAEQGAIVTVTANSPLSGVTQFEGFSSSPAGIDFTYNPGNPLEATFEMPNSPVTITANYSLLDADNVVVEVNITAGGLSAAVEQALADDYPGGTKADIKTLIIKGAMNGTDFNEIASKTGDVYNYAKINVLDLDGASCSGTAIFGRDYPSSIVELILPKNMELEANLRGDVIQGTWPNDVEYQLAFRLPKLAAIRIADTNPNYETIDGVLFTKGIETLIYYPMAKPDLYYTVPTGVETLGNSCFRFSTYLKAVLVSEGVTHCGDDAFAESLALESITFPKSLALIGSRALYHIRHFITGTEDANGAGRILPNGASGRTTVTPMNQIIFQTDTPPAKTGTWWTDGLMWDTNPFRFGVKNNAAVSEFIKPDDDGGWYAGVTKAGDGRTESGIGIYHSITVENAMSPYIYAVSHIPVPVIAEPINGEGLYFSRWESAGNITFDAPENPVTYFTMPQDNSAAVVTAIYRPLRNVTIVNGIASKTEAPEGQRIEIEPGVVAGKQFSHWVADGEGVVFGSPTSRETYFKMVDRNVTITAVFSDPYTVTVINGVTLSPTAVEGEVVEIMANGLHGFVNWTTESGITFEDENDRNTTFIMPAKDVTVTANFVSSIEEFESGFIGIYPNPAVDVIYVKGLNIESGYSVIDLMGRVILSNSGYESDAIDVSSLPSGVYFLQCDGKAIRFIKR